MILIIEKASTKTGAFNVEYKTENKTCEKHGDYEGRYYRISDKWIGGHCMTCTEDENKAKEDREERVKHLERRRKTEQTLQRALIPKRFTSKSLENFTAETESQKKAKSICEWYVSSFDDRLKAGTSLLFCGNVGTGKTHLSTAIANSVIESGHSALFSTLGDIIAQVKSTYSKDNSQTERDVVRSFVFPDLLIIDEVGVQDGSETDKKIVFEIINKRYEDVKPTIVLTNLSPSMLKEGLGERILDRLREGGGKMISFDWKSSRV